MSGIVEQPTFYPYMTAYENLKAHAILCEMRDLQKIGRLLDLVGLKDVGRKKVRNLIKELNSKHGSTFLICSHYISELEQTIDKIGIIRHGKLIEEKKIDEIKKDFVTMIYIKVDEIDKGLKLLEDRGIHSTLQQEEICLNENAIRVNELLGLFSCILR